MRNYYQHALISYGAVWHELLLQMVVIVLHITRRLPKTVYLHIERGARGVCLYFL